MVAVGELVHAFNAACRAAGFATPPRVARVERGSFVIRLFLGQEISDVQAAAGRIAAVLGVWGVEVTPIAVTDPGWCRVRLIEQDPMGAENHGFQDGSCGGLYLGTGADGQAVSLDRLTHMIIAGQTGSGKSIFLYHLLSALRLGAAILSGVDPSGLLFRPLPPDPLRASGLANPSRIVETLAALCRELDRRCALIPDDVDHVGPDVPLIVTVMEEYPGLLRALDASDPKRAKAARLYVSRLLAESRKCRMITILVAQRAEANIIGGAERAQAPTRITFGASSVEDVRLLHPESTQDLAETHIGAPPGIALLSRPCHRITRVRTPHVRYSEYARALRHRQAAA